MARTKRSLIYPALWLPEGGHTGRCPNSPNWKRVTSSIWNSWKAHVNCVIAKNTGSGIETITEFGNLVGSFKYTCGILAPNGNIYCPPQGAEFIGKIDIINETFTYVGASLGLGIEKWRCGILAPNGFIYGIPAHETTVLKFDPNTETWTKFGNVGVGSWKWSGAALAPNGCIYAAPGRDARILKINTINDSISYIGAPGAVSDLFLGAVLAPNGKIYFIPEKSTSIWIVDPSNDSVSTIGVFSGAVAKWRGGVLANNDAIYCIPKAQLNILKINTNDNSLSTFGPISGIQLFGTGCLAPNGYIYSMPIGFGSATTLGLRIDPNTDTFSEIDFSLLPTINGRTSGTVLGFNGNVYGIPHTSPAVVKLSFSHSVNFDRNVPLAAYWNKY